MFSVAKAVQITVMCASTAAVGKVLSEIVKNNTNPTNRFDQMQVTVGGAVLGMAVGKLAHDYVGSIVNDAIRVVQNARQESTND